MSNYSKPFASSIVASDMITDNGSAQSIPCGTNSIRRPSSIQLIKDGDVVKSINVQCSCGEVTRVVLSYE